MRGPLICVFHAYLIFFFYRQALPVPPLPPNFNPDLQPESGNFQPEEPNKYKLQFFLSQVNNISSWYFTRELKSVLISYMFPLPTKSSPARVLSKFSMMTPTEYPQVRNRVQWNGRRFSWKTSRDSVRGFPH